MTRQVTYSELAAVVFDSITKEDISSRVREGYLDAVRVYANAYIKLYQEITQISEDEADQIGRKTLFVLSHKHRYMNCKERSQKGSLELLPLLAPVLKIEFTR